FAVDVPTKQSHLRVDGYADESDYTSPQEGSDKFKMPARDRQEHGARLTQQLSDLEEDARLRASDQAARGTVLTLRGDPGYEIRLKSLDSIRSGIELLSVKAEGGSMRATVFVPPGKLTHFSRLVDGYLNKDTRWGKPANQKLVES